MQLKESQQNILVISLLSFAIATGCASEPVDKSTEIIASPNQKSSPAETTAAQSQTVSDQVDNFSQPKPSQEVVESAPVVEPVTVKVEAEEFDNIDQYVDGKKLSIPKVTGSVPPRDDEYHDTDNNAIVILQSPTLAMANFPRDRRKEVDWVKTLDEGFIEPRANLTGGDEIMTMDLDIVMKNTQFMPWVKFPHLAHTKWLACQNCHPKIFIPQEHANPISMNKVLRGEFCGVCHDKVSFSLFICERCHSVPHEGSGPAWWKKN